jgi:sugar phosphate isomerase/epimerase
MSHVSRRGFLKLSTLAGLAVAGTPLKTFAASSGAGPYHRTGKPRLRLALAAYSFRDNFPKMRGKANAKLVPGKGTDMFKFIDFCAAHDCEGAELTSYFFDSDSDEYMTQLKRHAYLRGVSVSGTAIGNNFSLPKGAKRDEEIALTKKWIDRAVLMGAPHIRVFAGVQPKDFPRAEADKMVISALEECGAYAAQRGVFLGLENHDSIGSAETLLPMVKAVNNSWVGVNLDSGNFRTADPYKDFAECVPYALNVQLKVEVHAAGGGKKPADMKRFTQILRDGGYQGWVALEYEAAENSAVAVPRILKELKELFAA